MKSRRKAKESRIKEPLGKCRLCLEVLQGKGNEVTADIESVIRKMFPADISTINIFLNPGITKKICDFCLSHLKDFSSFQSKIFEKHSKSFEFINCAVKVERVVMPEEEDILTEHVSTAVSEDYDPCAADDGPMSDPESYNNDNDERSDEQEDNVLNDITEVDELPEDLEHNLANWIIASDDLGTPTPNDKILAAAEQLLQQQSPSTERLHRFKDNWLDGFFKRNPEIMLQRNLSNKCLDDVETTEIIADELENEPDSDNDWIEKQTGKARKNYSEAALKNALTAIRNGMSIRSVARKFNIPRTTLSVKQKSKSYGSRTRTQTLSQALEKRLVRWILASDELGLPTTNEDIMTAAFNLSKLCSRDSRPIRAKSTFCSWIRGFFLRNPEVAHKAEVTKLYECDICGYTTLNKKPSLTDHFLKRHLNSKNEFKCKHCDKALSSKRILKYHVLSQHPRPGKAASFTCASCAKGFYTAKSLFQHEKQMHTKNHSCEECGKGFTTLYQLESHLKKFHLGNKCFTCDHLGCDKAYTTKAGLVTHRITKHFEMKTKSLKVRKPATARIGVKRKRVKKLSKETVIEPTASVDVEAQNTKCEAVDEPTSDPEYDDWFDHQEEVSNELEAVEDSELLSPELEMKLAKWIIDSDDIGAPTTNNEICAAAGNMLKSTDHLHRFTDSWLEGFLQRNSEIMEERRLFTENLADEDTKEQIANELKTEQDSDNDWIEEQASKTPKRYSEADIKNALKEVLNGSSVRSAARKFNIPYSTLGERRKGIKSLAVRTCAPSLSEPVEQKLVEWILTSDEMGVPKTVEDIISAAFNLAKSKNTNQEIRSKWIRGFFMRHPEVARKPETPKFYECDICGCKAKHKDQLSHHILRRHFKLEFKCKYCERTLKSVRSLKYHVASRHPKPGNSASFICVVCGKGFYAARNLLAHELQMHRKTHKCQDCDKKFSSSYSLDLHRKNVHLGLREYKCDHPGCGKAYANKAGIFRHRLEKHL